MKSVEPNALRRRPLRRGSDFDGRIAKSARCITAAEMVFQGRMNEFMASLMVGSDDERQQMRSGVLAAHEALLDAYEFNAWLLLERDGINPQRRHL